MRQLRVEPKFAWSGLVPEPGPTAPPEAANARAVAAASRSWDDVADEGRALMQVAVAKDEVRALVRDDGAQLVDVLPPREFADEHLAGAINIPLRKLDAEAVAVLDPGRPVIFYCHDGL